MARVNEGSRSSAATPLQCVVGSLTVTLLEVYSAESQGKRMLKIDQHFATPSGKFRFRSANNNLQMQAANWPIDKISAPHVQLSLSNQHVFWYQIMLSIL